MQRVELAAQRKELALSRAEHRRSAQADLRALHVDLTKMAMDDPTLAAVWNDYPHLSHSERRQMLFANVLYHNLFLNSEWGEASDDEIIVHARDMARSEAFVRYWQASRDLKLALPEGSRERRFAELFDGVVGQQSQPPHTRQG